MTFDEMIKKIELWDMLVLFFLDNDYVDDGDGLTVKIMLIIIIN